MKTIFPIKLLIFLNNYVLKGLSKGEPRVTLSMKNNLTGYLAFSIITSEDNYSFRSSTLHVKASLFLYGATFNLFMNSIT